MSEFEDKIHGVIYEEIVARGVVILYTTRWLVKMNEEELYEQAWWRLDNTVSQGTTAVDIKSDYGSSIKGVMKIIIVISRFKKSGTSSNHVLPINSAFLEAHTFIFECLLYIEAI